MVVIRIASNMIETTNDSVIFLLKRNETFDHRAQNQMPAVHQYK